MVLTDQNRRLFHESRQVEFDLTTDNSSYTVPRRPLANVPSTFYALLVQSQERLVSKDEIVKCVWSGVLSRQCSRGPYASLRKALGPERGLLKTAYGRGIGCWGAGTRKDADHQLRADLSDGSQQFRGNLPVKPPATRYCNDWARSRSGRRVDTIGDAPARYTCRHRRHRENQTCLEVAHSLAAQYPDGICLVELAPCPIQQWFLLPQPRRFGIDISNSNALDTIARSIGRRRLLVVLDTCEHVVVAATQLAETLLRHCLELRILATSQEPLRAEDEVLFSVPPLSVPAENVSAHSSHP